MDFVFLFGLNLTEVQAHPEMTPVDWMMTVSAPGEPKESKATQNQQWKGRLDRLVAGTRVSLIQTSF